MKIYIAGSLFNLEEQLFNAELTKRLRLIFADITFILPQEQSRQYTDDMLTFHDNCFKDCCYHVTTSDALISILEGADVDSGTCVELGMAYAKSIPIWGIRTDFRASEVNGLNLMVAKVCTELYQTPYGMLDDIINFLSAQINDLLRSNETIQMNI